MIFPVAISLVLDTKQLKSNGAEGKERCEYVHLFTQGVFLRIKRLNLRAEEEVSSVQTLLFCHFCSQCIRGKRMGLDWVVC